MNLKRLAGLDILAEKYAYGHDAEFGYMSESRVADRWVATTCGYCSVGCGMLVGVREGRAVAARGDRAAPGESRQALPQGTERAPHAGGQGRAQYPLLRKNGKLERVSWDEALDTMVERVGAHPGAARRGRVRRDQHRATGDRGILRARQTGATRLRHQQLRRQHDALHGQRGGGLQAQLRQRRPSRDATTIWPRPT